MWLLFATTGMRRGEVLGVAWDDIDLVNARLSIHWTWGVVRAKPTWRRQAKSRAGQRTMALDPATVQVLRSHRAAQAQERLFAGPAWHEANHDWRGEQRTGLVFTWPDGSMINPARVSRWFSEHVVAAQLPSVRLHDVRHTYASTALANSTGWHDVKIVSQRLGTPQSGSPSTRTLSAAGR